MLYVRGQGDIISVLSNQQLKTSGYVTVTLVPLAQAAPSNQPSTLYHTQFTKQRNKLSHLKYLVFFVLKK